MVVVEGLFIASLLTLPDSANLTSDYQGYHIAVVNNGGGGRIRTFEVDDGRFTVCSLWPLGNPTTGHCMLLLACFLVGSGAHHIK